MDHPYQAPHALLGPPQKATVRVRMLLVVLLAAIAGAASHIIGIFVDLPGALMGPLFALGYFVANRFIRAGLAPSYDTLSFRRQVRWLLLVVAVYIPAVMVGVAAGSRVPASRLVPFVGGS